jgi:Matrixin
MQTAISLWNGAGSAFRFIGGTIGPPRCSEQFLGTYRISVSFMDPCGEISNSGGTLAIAGSYFTRSASATVNGRSFRLALEGFVINNDSSVALELLQTTGCFQDTQLHELGHVLGLGHSIDTTAIMFPSINRECFSSSHGLGTDDVRGIQFIYPTLSGEAPGQPTITRVVASDEVLTIDWAASPGAVATTHRLDFFSGATLVVTLAVGPATSARIPIPLGAQGSFTVRVTSFAGEIPGPPSNPFPFVLGGPASCTGPPGQPSPTGGVMAGTATASWPSVAGALRYVIQVGTTLGAADLLAPTDIGPATFVSASGVPAGFSAWLRIAAINECGTGPPADLLVQ